MHRRVSAAIVRRVSLRSYTLPAALDSLRARASRDESPLQDRARPAGRRSTRAADRRRSCRRRYATWGPLRASCPGAGRMHPRGRPGLPASTGRRQQLGSTLSSLASALSRPPRRLGESAASLLCFRDEHLGRDADFPTERGLQGSADTHSGTGGAAAVLVSQLARCEASSAIGPCPGLARRRPGRPGCEYLIGRRSRNRYSLAA
jgi:hypothetical protein